MPTLSAMQVTQLRNLQSVQMTPNSHINVISGENGSGKTSLLEAISILAMGRSFRTRKYRNLIHHSASEFVLFAAMANESRPGVDTRIGLQRQRSGHIMIKVDGRNISTAAELAHLLPVVVVDGDVFQILQGAPQERRMFFDWLVFHVKHQFADSWKHYAKCIKQRNSLLRRDKITRLDLAPWDREIAKHGCQIELARTEMLDTFLKTLRGYLQDFEFADDITLTYVSGWRLSAEEGLNESAILAVLDQRMEHDMRAGYTSFGCHKSDLKVMVAGKDAAEILSRGQQKVLTIAMFFAKAQAVKQANGLNPVFLLDDLPAELDQHHLALVGEWLDTLAPQVFVTCVDSSPLMRAWSKLFVDENRLTMFHVKHGDVCLHEVETDKAHNVLNHSNIK